MQSVPMLEPRNENRAERGNHSLARRACSFHASVGSLVMASSIRSRMETFSACPS